MATDTFFASCPNAPADISVSATVDVASGIATFSSPETNSIMGVGMVVDYDVDNKNMYIVGKISTTQWNVLAADGSTPGDVTGKTVNSITSPFSSNELAETGISALIGGQNLVALDLTVSVPQYCEQTTYTADTTYLDMSGWTTDATRTFRYYSPSDTTNECNLTMRPQNNGWDATKPRMQVGGVGCMRYRSGQVLHITIEGMQIRHTSTIRPFLIQSDAGSVFKVKKNIIIKDLASDNVANSSINYATITQIDIENNIF